MEGENSIGVLIGPQFLQTLGYKDYREFFVAVGQWAFEEEHNFIAFSSTDPAAILKVFLAHQLFGDWPENLTKGETEAFNGILRKLGMLQQPHVKHIEKKE